MVVLNLLYCLLNLHLVIGYQCQKLFGLHQSLLSSPSFKSLLARPGRVCRYHSRSGHPSTPPRISSRLPKSQHPGPLVCPRCTLRRTCCRRARCRTLGPLACRSSTSLRTQRRQSSGTHPDRGLHHLQSVPGTRPRLAMCTYQTL